MATSRVSAPTERPSVDGIGFFDTTSMMLRTFAMPSSTAPRERARGGWDARAEVRAQRRLDALGLGEGDLRFAEARVDRPVKDESPDLVGIRARVDRAEVRPIGEPQVIELLFADDGSQHVEIARGAHGVDVRQERTGVREAFLPEFVRQLVLCRDPRVAATGSRWNPVDEPVELLRVEAHDTAVDRPTPRGS